LKRINWFLLSVGIVLLLNTFLLILFSNINAGVWALGAFGTLFLIFGSLYRFHRQKIFIFSLSAFLSGSFLALLCVISLYIYGDKEDVSFEEDAVIVLGAGILGEEPGPNLKYRLDKAYDYHIKNPNALIIVSGGKGPQEDMTEAFAMERYLVKKGVPSRLIIREERSVSTYENFLFSMEILNDIYSEPYSLAFISNDFHILRASLIAEKAGFDDIGHWGCRTPLLTLLSGALRECMALFDLWIFG